MKVASFKRTKKCRPIAFNVPNHYSTCSKLLLGGDVKNENSSSVLSHQFKSGHFKCKTQIRQNNWVGTPRKGPNPHPYYKVSVPVDKNFNFWIPSKTISCDHSFESSCCTDFKYVIHYLIYTPWKLLQHFKCWMKNNSCKEKLAIAFRLQARLSLKLLNSSENGCCFNTLDESFKRNWAAQF